MKPNRLFVILLTVCVMCGAAWQLFPVSGRAQKNQEEAKRLGRITNSYEEAGQSDSGIGQAQPQPRPSWVEEALERSYPSLHERRPNGKNAGAPDGRAEFKLLAAAQDELGFTHLRFAQMYRGVPVFGAQLVAHTDTKEVRYLSGHTVDDLEIETTPVVTSAQASEIAKAAFHSEAQVANEPQAELMVLPNRLFDPGDKIGATLVYQVDLHIANDTAVAKQHRYFIDALSGRPVRHYSFAGPALRQPFNDRLTELEPVNESGALKASFRDIFGAGNQVQDAASDAGIQRLANPAIDHYGKLIGGTDCAPISGVAGNDNCWVSQNSGIQNKAFFLLAEGGTHPVSDITVNGIGRDKAEMIFYRALISLSPTAQFADAREESVQAAADLFGKGSQEETATAAAWAAVGKSSTACTVTILPAVTIPQEGGQATIPVTVSSQSCAWQISNPNSWITIVSGASGVGNGSVTISVGPNPTNSLRQGELGALGTLLVSIKQPVQPCTIVGIPFGQTINGQLNNSDCYVAGLPGMYSGTTNSPFRYVDVYYFYGAAGQPISITMNSSTVDSYLVLQGPNSPYHTIATSDDYRGTLNARIPGTGNFLLPATGKYAIWATTAPKAGSSKSGAYSLTLTTTCTYSLSSTGAAFWTAGGTGSFNVTTPGNCGWLPQSNVPWITFDYLNLFPSAGNGAVNYTVAPNPSGLNRTGTITVAGQTFTVVQMGTSE